MYSSACFSAGHNGDDRQRFASCVDGKWDAPITHPQPESVNCFQGGQISVRSEPVGRKGVDLADSCPRRVVRHATEPTSRVPRDHDVEHAISLAMRKSPVIYGSPLENTASNRGTLADSSAQTVASVPPLPRA